MQAFIFLLTITLANSLQCLDETGDLVDIWLALKGPKGTNYMYWDTKQEDLILSKYSLNDTNFGALSFTLQQLWNDSIEYILWNDEPAPNPLSPTGQPYSYNYGHSKGVWIWNPVSEEAVILQHSIPLFPQGPTMVDSYEGLKENAWEFGQHVGCFSVKLEDLVGLAKMMQLIKIHIYDSNVSQDSPQILQDLASGNYLEDPLCLWSYFQTPYGKNITFFAKSKQWDNEMYSACISPKFNSNLVVESWIRGDKEGPYCNSTNQVLDVESVQYTDDISFSEWDDHSKWALGNDFFCISDINRMTTQYVRGGSSFCWKSDSLVKAMNLAIQNTDSCS